MQGWIKLYRKIFDNPVMLKPNYLAIWIYLLINANHRDNYFVWNNKKTLIRRGEQITSIKEIAKSFKLDRGTVKRIFEYLKSDEMINFETTNKFTKIDILNYEKYQETDKSVFSKSFQKVSKTHIKKSSDTPPDIGLGEGAEMKNNIKFTSNSHQIHTNKNVNNVNNKEYVQNEFEQPTILSFNNEPTKEQLVKVEFEKFWNYYNKKINRKKCFVKWKRLSATAKNKIKEHLPKYIKSTPDKKYRKNPSTYLNNESWNDEIINKTSAADNYNTQSIFNETLRVC